MKISKEIIDKIFPIIKEAGDNLKKNFKLPKEYISYENHDIKLELDLKTELFLKNELSLLFPDFDFIAEESANETIEKEDTFYWVIDPIDGTSNYFQQIPHFCISVALRKNGENILGIIYDIFRDELFWAIKGNGAYLNGKRLQIKEIPLDKSFCVIGLYKTEETIKKASSLLEEIAKTFHKVRITGSAALDLAWLACNRFQGFLEYGIRLWDVAAGEVIVKEAGGNIILKPFGSEKFSYLIIGGTKKAVDALLNKILKS